MSKMIQCAVISALALSLINCGANEEDRKKAWDTAQTRATELKTTYPNFATLIDAQKAEATKAWEEANKISDKEKKVEAMGEATKKLTVLTGRLGEVQSKSASIRSDIKRMNEMKIMAKDTGKRRQVASDVSVTLSNVNAAVVGATPKTVAEAEAVLKDQISALISAQNKVSSAISSMKPKKAKKSKKKKK